jgi:hypothetical protein
LLKAVFDALAVLMRNEKGHWKSKELEEAICKRFNAKTCTTSV